MKYLRQHIRKIIMEGMTSPNSVSGKYAIWTNLADPSDVDNLSDGTELDFLMYDWQNAYDGLEKMITVDSLDPEVRDQFMTIMNEVTATRNAESTRVNNEAKEAIVAAGGEVRQLSGEQRQAWVDVMKPVWEQFSGDVGQDMIDAAQSFNTGS